ncbi:YeeE/YedE family protein [Slackia heliotrinireducens]|jgi:uncharacterized membrane protein YedE/YeeE|uniref:YeeE/YedE family protein n=1 Tax=Slackia heliotrinireducens TaxID=84110 RepID=UPI003315A03E
MMYLSGLIVGVLFGIFLKKSRFCLTGLIRDTYMEKKPYNAVIVFSIIAVQGLIYHSLAHAGLIRLPSYLPPFSLVSIAVGSLLFGIGAVVSSGCIASTLVKCGDGRIAGLISLATFMVTGYALSAGPLVELSKAIRSVAIVDDNLAIRTTVAPIVICGVASVVLIAVMVRYRMTHKPKFRIPGRYTGVRHILFEKVWPVEVSAVLIGILAGFAFLISGHYGRHFGFALVTPLLSWAYELLQPPFVVGGCNPYDTVFGWGSMFVLGIVLGSLITTAASGELTPVMPDKTTALKMVIGGVLMGFGGVWGQGCLIANGLVGTAQFSLKSWYALVFLVAGIWLATRLYLMPSLQKASKS